MRMFPHTQDYDVIMSHLLFLTAALLPYGLQLNIKNFYFPIAGGAMLKKQNKQHTKTNPKQNKTTFTNQFDHNLMNLFRQNEAYACH